MLNFLANCKISGKAQLKSILRSFRSYWVALCKICSHILFLSMKSTFQRWLSKSQKSATIYPTLVFARCAKNYAARFSNFLANSSTSARFSASKENKISELSFVSAIGNWLKPLKEVLRTTSQPIYYWQQLGMPSL